MSLRDDIVRIALGECGNSESNGGDMKYINWYGGFGSGTAWCAIFVSWCANQAGMLNNYVPKYASCDVGKSWFSGKGWYQTSHAYGGNYTPQTGDIIFFSGKHTTSDSTHTGIVVSCDGSTVYTVEGNTSNMVAQRSYSISSNYIIGYGLPQCGDATGSWGDTGGVSTTPGQGAVPDVMSDKTVTYRDYTVQQGDTLQSIADKFNTTPAMLANVNNLSGGTVRPGQVIKVPVETSRSGNSSVGSLAAKQTIVKRHSRGVTVSNPYAKVKLYTETGLLTITQEVIVSNTNLNRDILSISTNRDMGQDCPTFTITLCWRNEWYTKISPNDLIVIELTRPPEKSKPVFFGLVDDVRKSCDYNSKNPTRTLSVTGRGFNKALINFVIGTISELNATASIMGFMADQINVFTGGSPGQIITGVLENYLGKGCNYTFGNNKKFMDYYQQSIKSNSNSYEFLADTSSFLSYQGSLWDYIKELKNAPFNELFWEIVNDRPTLVFRPTPFNEEDWVKLLRITIKDLDIVQENIGQSDLETYTVYKVTSETFASDTADLGYLPLWYPAYYTKYGLTRLDVKSKYINYESGDNTNTQKANVLSKTIDIFNWNILNNSMKNGTLVVKGSNQYTVGSRIITEADNMEYYVEAVSHNFTNFSGWTTTLQLTRGIEPQNRFSAPWGLWQQLTPTDISNIFGYDINAVASSGITVDSDGTTVITGNSLTEKTWNALKSLGYSDIAVAGAMGNIHYESGGFNPSAVEGGSGEGLGLCQWSFGRKTQLKNYAASLGKSPTDETVQIQFLCAELTPGGTSFADYQLMTHNGYSPNQWINATSVDAATRAFCWTFERPNSSAGNSSMSQRISAAQSYYNQYHR